MLLGCIVVLAHWNCFVCKLWYYNPSNLSFESNSIQFCIVNEIFQFSFGLIYCILEEKQFGLSELVVFICQNSIWILMYEVWMLNLIFY